MHRILAMIGGLLVGLVVYLVLWFIASHVLEGFGGRVEICAHLVVIGVSLAAGVRSFRRSVGIR